MASHDRDYGGAVCTGVGGVLTPGLLRPEAAGMGSVDSFKE